MPARAESGYEQEPVLNAKDLATPELLSGPHFTVDPKVPVKGFIERFTIRSKYGTFQANGLRILPIRPPVVARYWVVLVSSMILPARRTLILNGLPGGAPANLLRMFSMLSSDTTGMPSTERMTSPPRATSFPPIVTILSPPCRPMFHAIEP